MSIIIWQDIGFVLILVCLAIPLGIYIEKVMSGQRVILSRIFLPVENIIYKLTGVSKNEEMTPKVYALSVLAFSMIGFVFLFLLQMLQSVLFPLSLLVAQQELSQITLSHEE